MFTGLIQHLGTLKRLTPGGSEAEIEVASSLESLSVGESIAVMGACLTVTGVGPGFFKAFASEETLAKTGFRAMRPGAGVNLERALRAGDPLGGHLVTGHVDACVELLKRTRIGQAERLTVALPRPPLDRQIAPKGSVARERMAKRDIASLAYASGSLRWKRDSFGSTFAEGALGARGAVPPPVAGRAA